MSSADSEPDRVVQAPGHSTSETREARPVRRSSRRAVRERARDRGENTTRSRSQRGERRGGEEQDIPEELTEETQSEPEQDPEFQPAPSTGQRRLRGQAVRGRGSGRGGRSRSQREELRRQEERDNAARIAALSEARREETQRTIHNLDLEELRELATELFARQPGLMFDALLMIQRRHDVPPAPAPGVPWCVCGNCRQMDQDIERKCCGFEPENCISRLQAFEMYCLQDEILRIHRNYRFDITAMGRGQEPGDDNKEFRFAGYRSFIYWHHGALGRGNRRVIPSCCIWRIRDKWPSPTGQYTGYIPGH